MKKCTFILYFFIVFYTASAQYLTPVYHDIQLQFTHLDYTGLYRNHDPFLYIKTKKGIIRYDGKKFVQKNRKKENSEISALFHDGSQMWLGYEDGAVFTWNNQNFLPWKIEEGWPKSKITSFGKIPASQTLWLTTYGEGLYYHDGKHLFNINEDDGLGGNDIYCSVALKNDRILVATDKGLFLCDIKNNYKSVVPFQTQPESQNQIFTKLWYDQKSNHVVALTYEGEIWIADGQSQNIYKKEVPFEIRSGITSGNGKIYIIDEKGDFPLQTYDLLTKKTEKFKLKGLENEISMIDMIIDSDGILWLLCKNNGLLSLQSELIVYDLPQQNIQVMASTENGHYLGDETGLYLMSYDGQQKILLKNENIISIRIDENNQKLWAGTYGNGLIIIDLQTGKQKKTDETTGLINNNVFSITKANNEILVATLAGIQIFDTGGNPKSTLTSADGLPTDYIYTLYTDKLQHVWIGTEGKGLLKYSDGKINTIIPNESVISVCEGGGEVIWFVSTEKGLGYHDRNKTIWLTKNDGLTSDKISGIASESDGTLMVFHEFGIDKIDPVTKEIMYSGNPTPFSKWKQNYNSFSKTNSHYFLALSGHMIRIRRSPGVRVKPKLVANLVQCGNIFLSQKSTNILPHDQHNLKVDFSGIYFRDPEHLQYRYKLEPMESDWRYTRDPSLLYTELSPGTYTFTMEIGLANAYFPKESYTCTFTIKAPFYKTLWFLLSTGLLLMMLAYALIQFTIQQKKKMSDIENEKVKMQLDTLKSQINPHFLFNSFNTLIGTIEENQKDAVIYVEKLSDFYRNMLEYRDKNLISLEEEIKIHSDYLFLLKQRYRDNLIIDIDAGSDLRSFYVIPLTLQLLTENAVKHNVISASRPLTIRIYIAKQYLVVSNTMQPKMTKEKSTHFGLQSLSKRYKDLTQKDVIISDKENIFSVRIPLQSYDTHIDH